MTAGARKPARRRVRAKRETDASFVCGDDLEIVSWTSEAESMFGWSAAEAHGRNVFDLLRSEFLDVDRSTLTYRLRKSGRVRANLTHACKDGGRVVVDFRLSETIGAGGTKSGFLCSNSEVGRGSGTRFNGVQVCTEILDQIPGMFWITDPGLRFVLSSGAALASIGLVRNRWIGRTVCEFFGADESESAVAAHRAALAGTSGHFDTVWRGRVLRCWVAPLRNPGGRIVGTVGRAEDVTEEARVEEGFRQQTKLLETIIQQAAEGIAVCDAGGHFTLINEAARSLSGLGARDDSDVTLDEARSAWKMRPTPRGKTVAEQDLPISRALRGERTIGQEVEVIRPDGSRFCARVSAAPIRNDAGEVVAAVTNIYDISAQKETERALREQSELLRLVLDNIGAGVIVVDEREQPVIFNPAAREILRERPTGTLREEWGERLGVYHADKVTPYTFEDLPPTRALRGEAADVPAIFLRNPNVPEGIWLKSSSRPLVGDDGAVRGAVVVFQEITERKQAEHDLEARVAERTAELAEIVQKAEHEIAERRLATAELERSRLLLQKIVDNNTAVIYLKDREGRYLLINARYEEIFHFSKEQAIGKTDYELIGPEWAPALRANDALVLEADRPLQFEETVIQDDGPHTYVSVKFPLHGPDGIAFGVCGISTDITDRRRMEDDLRRSEGEISTLIETSTDAIWSVDHDYRIGTINSVVRDIFERMFGTSPGPGDRVSAHVTPQAWAHWKPYYDRALAGERFVFAESLTIDGETRSFLISMTPISGSGETVTGVTAIGKDVTDLKEAEEEVRRNQAELAHVLRVSTVGEMAAGFAHEINQPLGAIANYARGCKRRIESGQAAPADLAGAVEEIAQQALRAGEIIRRLRDLVRKQEVRRELFDLNDLVAQAVRVVQFEAERKAMTVVQDLAGVRPAVEGDAIQIQQVVLNLLLNGIESMDQSPAEPRELTVRTAVNGTREVEVSVSDRGRGLPPLLAERLFEPFVGTKPDGLGMGLAISRRIVEAHGGRIWASANPDRGTTFRFVLPVADEADSFFAVPDG